MKTPRFCQLFPKLIPTAILCVGLCGCAWSIGGKDEGHTTVNRPTQGQELIDLKAALDKGAISQQEYDCARQRILDRD